MQKRVINPKEIKDFEISVTVAKQSGTINKELKIVTKFDDNLVPTTEFVVIAKEPETNFVTTDLAFAVNLFNDL